MSQLSRSLSLVLCLWLYGCGGQSSPPSTTTPVSPAKPAGPVSQKLPFEEVSGESKPMGQEADGRQKSRDEATTQEEQQPQGLRGRWKLTISVGQAISQPWLVEISGPEDSYDVRVLDTAPRMKPAEIKEFKKVDDQVQFLLAVDDQSWSFEGSVVGPKVQGTLELPTQPTLAWLERTSDKNLRASRMTPVPGAEEFEAVQEIQDPKEQVKRLLGIMEERKDSALAFESARGVIKLAKDAGLSRDEVAQVIELTGELAKPWGSRWAEFQVETIAYDLASADAYPELALEYAETALAALERDSHPARRRRVQLTHAIALLRNNRAEESKKTIEELRADSPDDGELTYYGALASEKMGDANGAIELLTSLWPHPIATRELERVWKDQHGTTDGLEQRLDEVYLERFPPLQVEPYPGRAEPAQDHVVVMELFTGTGCPPCVASDVAFEALGRAFQRTELVLLQYHIHVPSPDPLTSPDALARSEYYQVPGTPSIFVNGEEGPPGGGRRQQGPDIYSNYRELIERKLQLVSAAKIELNATQEDDKVQIEVKLQDVADPGEKLRLRLALVEDEVRFMAPNGMRFHHAVVRALPGGTEGVPVTEAAMTHKQVINLSEIKASLAGSLGDFERQHNYEFPSKPLDLEHIAMVAFVQDDVTRAIAQSAFAKLGGPSARQEQAPSEESK